jgi:hypothetical protein
VAVLDRPPFCIVNDVESVDQRRGFTEVEQVRGTGALVPFEVANRGD